MLTPQNFREKTFERAIFGGYDMAAVDDFLEEAANDYAAVAKENMVLKSKMKVLVDKIEEYRSTEDSMRMTLLSAQKLCAQMEQEAKERAEATVANAKVEAERTTAAARLEAERVVRDAHDQRVTEEARLLEAKKESSKYIEDMHLICTKQLEFLENLESFKLAPEQLEQVQTPEPIPFPAAEPVVRELPTVEVPRVEETVRSIEDSVERMDGPSSDGDIEISRVVTDGADAPQAENEEPTRMYTGGGQQAGTPFSSLDNMRFGK